MDTFAPRADPSLGWAWRWEVDSVLSLLELLKREGIESCTDLAASKGGVEPALAHAGDCQGTPSWWHACNNERFGIPAPWSTPLDQQAVGGDPTGQCQTRTP